MVVTGGLFLPTLLGMLPPSALRSALILPSILASWRTRLGRPVRSVAFYADM
jgi:hypothetical protein